MAQVFTQRTSYAFVSCSNFVVFLSLKCINVDVHFVRECVSAKHLVFHHLPSLDQVADIFTKSLSTL